MNEADSTPSPSRFCSRFGIRSAARNAPAAARQPEVVRDHALADEAGDPRQEDARADRERAAEAARAGGGIGHRPILVGDRHGSQSYRERAGIADGR